MSLSSMTQAVEFVSCLELPAAPSSALEALAEETQAFDLSAAKNQSMVVGSDMISFIRGVTPERRSDIVSLMAFGLTATSTLTQVLFFKSRSSDVTLKHFSGKITIDSEILAGVRQAISQKISKFVKSYVEALPDL